MQNGIVVAGPLIVDQHYAVERYPKEGTLSLITATSRDMGGAGNVVGSLSRLDGTMPLHVTGFLGNDANGRFLKDTVRTRFPNVSLDWLVEEGENSFTVIIDSLDSRERTFLSAKGSAEQMADATLPWDHIGGDIFLLEYLLMGLAMDGTDSEYGTDAARILHHARQRGMRTAIDLVSHPGPEASRICRDAFAYVDICAINEIEAEAATGIRVTGDQGVDASAVKKALSAMRNMGVAQWVVIHMPLYCYGLDVQSGRFLKMPTLDLPQSFIKGKTGAGDAFLAGLLYTAWQGKPLDEGIAMGVAASSSSLAGVNGTDTVLPYTKLPGLLSRFGGQKKAMPF
ncbi:MAG: carbohydrate kinase family protein [Sphaerochaeta sp.]|jgi:sugar/nucleoside kinase (ribokinase family)|nr:carbohydrate kinase family protein [Sphaerochaeta sp.]